VTREPFAGRCCWGLPVLLKSAPLSLVERAVADEQLTLFGPLHRLHGQAHEENQFGLGDRCDLLVLHLLSSPSPRHPPAYLLWHHQRLSLLPQRFQLSGGLLLSLNTLGHQKAHLSPLLLGLD
jgi:hypothetical protein